MSKWYSEKGKMNETVVSGGIRLSRNIDCFPFPSRLDSEGRRKVAETVRSIIFADEERRDFGYIDMQTLSRYQAISLAERRIVSPDFVSSKEERGLILSADEGTGIMLCEEDHISIQVMKAGLALEEAYAEADRIDTLIDSKVGYAFDDRMGYLTANPANLGTGMRAFVILHLPALTATGRISRLASTISRLGLSITGAYGSRSQPVGDFYRISNSITLGITEETAISNLSSIVLQFAAQEKAAAAEQIKMPEEEDKIYRAAAILKSARLLSCSEFMELISAVRLGAAAGITDIPVELIDALTVEVQPATLSASDESIASVTQRDKRRAEIVRSALGGFQA